MNFAEIETMWRSPRNRPTAAELEREKMKFVAHLRRQRRGFMLWIVVLLSVLTTLTVKFLLFALTAAPGDKGFNLEREWAAIPFFLMPWGVAIGFAVQFWRHRTRHPNPERSVPETLRALLDENRLARTRVKVAAILHGVFLLLLPAIVYQLRAVGKAGDEILIAAFVLWPSIAIAIGLALRFQYRCRLLPRERELQSVLSAYEADAQR